MINLDDSGDNIYKKREYFGKDVFKTKMMWTGIKKEEDMNAILDYLEKQK